MILKIHPSANRNIPTVVADSFPCLPILNENQANPKQIIPRINKNTFDVILFIPQFKEKPMDYKSVGFNNESSFNVGDFSKYENGVTYFITQQNIIKEVRLISTGNEGGLNLCVWSGNEGQKSFQKTIRKQYSMYIQYMYIHTLFTSYTFYNIIIHIKRTSICIYYIQEID